MKNIYESLFLSISYCLEKDLFIQDWIQTPENVEQFQTEMFNYVQLYNIHRPSNTLWLQQNFVLLIDENLQCWIEKEVNKPCFTYGNKKCAFVVNKDLFSNKNVVNSFDQQVSSINTKYFASKGNALKWLLHRTAKKKTENTYNVVLQGTDEDGNIILKVPPFNIKQTIKAIEKTFALKDFIEKNDEKNQQLTKREKEILSLISSEQSHEQISISLHISIHTVRAHLRTIKRKLSFDNNSDYQNFVKVFY